MRDAIAWHELNDACECDLPIIWKDWINNCHVSPTGLARRPTHVTGKPRILNPLLKCGSNDSPGISLLMQRRSRFQGFIELFAPGG